mgnify:CR=1 FL=1
MTLVRSRGSVARPRFHRWTVADGHGHPEVDGPGAGRRERPHCTGPHGCAPEKEFPLWHLRF